MAFFAKSKWAGLLAVPVLACLPLACSSSPSSDASSSTGVSSDDQAALASIAKLPHKDVCDRATLKPGQVRCHAKVRTETDGTIKAFAAPSGLGPADLQSAYKIDPSLGAGITVAIVDAMDDPKAESDLAQYRSTFGLPPCTTANGCFKKVNENGAASPLPAVDNGWAGEISLDLDMVSAICPNCKILLVEANQPSLNDLGTAVKTAVAMGAAVVSNSYGGGEDPTQGTADTQFFNNPGHGIFASSGDNGFGVEYPASSAHVIGVGGTSLTKSTNARGWVEAAWNGAGSGCSTVTAKPTYQNDTGCAKKSVADISAVADPNTGVAVFDTQGEAGFLVFGGTSAAAPIVATIFAMTGHGATDGQFVWQNTGDFFDVTTGTNGTCSGAGAYLCKAGAGFDGPTGWGTPNGSLLTGTTPPADGGTDAPVDSPPPDAGTCSHSDCTTGTKLVATCDPCVTKICAADSFCCNTSWDSVCVGEVKSICGQTCGAPPPPPDAGTCTHSECTTGTKLVKTCDACVTKICTADAFCCSTTWDSICVSEVGSICGQTCN